MMTTASNACGWLFTVGAAVWTVMAAPKSSAPSPTPWSWRCLVGLAVVAFRIPQLLAPNPFNPDESLCLAGALTLLHDPRYWISVDGGTAGPLYFFAQIPAALFPGSAAFLVSRLIAIALVVGTVFATGRLLRAATSATVEQLAILPACVAYGLSRMPDLQHFSTEILPIFVVACVASIAFGTEGTPTSRRWWTIGILLGLVPYAKIQATPIALGLGLVVTVREMRRSGPSALVALGMSALIPTFVVAVYLTAFNAWPNALIPYFFHNVEYVEGASQALGTVVALLVRTVWDDTSLAVWTLVGLVAVVAVPIWSSERASRLRLLAAGALAWLAVALATVLIPSRPLLHYLYLLLSPWLLLVGCALHAATTDLGVRRHFTPRRTAGGLLAITLLPLAAVSAFGADHYAWLTARFVSWHDETVAMAKIIRPYQRPGDSLAVWGMRSDLYVECGLPQAVTQGDSPGQIYSGPWQRYYLKSYATGFARHSPAFFVDAVGPGNFAFQDRASAHEAFPLLREIIRTQYTQMAEIGGSRVYVRNDRLQVTPVLRRANPP